MQNFSSEQSIVETFLRTGKIPRLQDNKTCPSEWSDEISQWRHQWYRQLCPKNWSKIKNDHRFSKILKKTYSNWLITSPINLKSHITFSCIFYFLKCSKKYLTMETKMRMTKEKTSMKVQNNRPMYDELDWWIDNSKLGGCCYRNYKICETARIIAVEMSL